MTHNTLITSISFTLTQNQSKYIYPHYQSQEFQMWRISDKLGRAVHCKKNLITTVLESNQPLLLEYDESPNEWNIPGNWQEVGRHIWKIDPNLTVTNFFDWVQLGGWLLNAAENPVGSWPDIFKVSPAQIEQFMTDNNIPITIASFWDDIDWIIALKQF